MRGRGQETRPRASHVSILPSHGSLVRMAQGPSRQALTARVHLGRQDKSAWAHLRAYTSPVHPALLCLAASLEHPGEDRDMVTLVLQQKRTKPTKRTKKTLLLFTGISPGPLSDPEACPPGDSNLCVCTELLSSKPVSQGYFRKGASH